MQRVRPQIQSKSVNRRGYAVVRVVVAGDRQTGKSSLIHAASYKFPPYCDGVPLKIIDTSYRINDRDRVDEELQRADVVVLTYACDRPQTLENISTFWLPRLRNLEEVSLEEAMSPLMQQFCEIEAYLECSVTGSFQENKKYLVLRDNSEGGVTKLLANKESLASCDIAVFVHDRCDESTLKASSELLSKVVGHGEDTGFQVPGIVIAAKDDQDSLTMAIQEASAIYFVTSFIYMLIFIIVLCIFLYIIVGWVR